MLAICPELQLSLLKRVTYKVTNLLHQALHPHSLSHTHTHTHTYKSCCQRQGWHVSLCLVFTCSEWALNVTCLSPLHLPDSSSLSSLCIWSPCVCVWERQRHHVLVCTRLMDTLLLSTSLCTAPASTMMPTALIFSCHFIIMSPLFIRPPPRSLSRFLSFILSLLSRASLFYFSNSTNPTTTPLDPFLCLTVPMLVISALSVFFPLCLISTS